LRSKNRPIGLAGRAIILGGLSFYLLPTFQKSERLSDQRVIEALFANKGTAYLCYPVRIVWVASPRLSQTQVLVSVSKKRFKKAVDRNRIKRLIRSAWRLHKASFSERLEAIKHPPVGLLLLYVGKEILSYPEVEQGVLRAIRKWSPAEPSTPAPEKQL
jgi:ribonuclease P protein component